MNHLTDEQLNEYLDAGTQVPTRTHTGTHLASCDACRARLKELQGVFSALASLPEVVPPRDLTASILQQLPPRRSKSPSRPAPALKWLSVMEAAGALAVFAWLASSFILPPEIANYQLPTIDALVASTIIFLTSLSVQVPDPTFILQPSSFDLESTTLLLFIVSAAILWLVGNGLLLRSPLRESRK